jgi:glycosyltransferase involved in cell wall biosynthesis
VELLGSRTNEHVKQAMEWADVFVLPCRVDDKGERDGIPVAVVEAMAAGVPVVGGDLVTLRELIEHETSGMLVRPGSVEDLATALRTLIEQPERRDALAKTARERIEAEFALTLNIERLHGMFLQMAGVVPDRPADASVPEREPEQQAA